MPVMYLALFGQTDSIPVSESNLEKFLHRDGSLIYTEFVELVVVNEIRIKVVHLLDMLTKDSISGVRFELDYYIGTENFQRITMLDSDEVNVLINSLKIMQNSIFKKRQGNNAEKNG